MTTKTRTATNPAAPQSDPVSDKAPGVRTEAEVIAAEQATAEQAANSAPPGATGNPALNATDEQLAAAAQVDLDDEDDEEVGKLVHYVRESDGTVQSVNEGTAEHRLLDRSGEWSETTRREAKAAKTRSFVRTAKAKA